MDEVRLEIFNLANIFLAGIDGTIIPFAIIILIMILIIYILIIKIIYNIIIIVILYIFSFIELNNFIPGKFSTNSFCNHSKSL